MSARASRSSAVGEGVHRASVDAPEVARQEVAGAGHDLQACAGYGGGDVPGGADAEQRVPFAVHHLGRCGDPAQRAAGPRRADLTALGLVVAETGDAVLGLLGDELAYVLFGDVVTGRGEDA